MAPAGLFSSQPFHITDNKHHRWLLLACDHHLTNMNQPQSHHHKLPTPEPIRRTPRTKTSKARNHRHTDQRQSADTQAHLPKDKRLQPAHAWCKSPQQSEISHPLRVCFDEDHSEPEDEEVEVQHILCKVGEYGRDAQRILTGNAIIEVGGYCQKHSNLSTHHPHATTRHIGCKGTVQQREDHKVKRSEHVYDDQKRQRRFSSNSRTSHKGSARSSTVSSTRIISMYYRTSERSAAANELTETPGSRPQHQIRALHQ